MKIGVDTAEWQKLTFNLSKQRRVRPFKQYFLSSLVKWEEGQRIYKQTTESKYEVDM